MNLCYFKVATMQYRKGLSHSMCRQTGTLIAQNIKKVTLQQKKKQCNCHRLWFQISQSELYLTFIWFLKETRKLQNRWTLLKSTCWLLILHTKNRNATTLKDKKKCLHVLLRVLEFHIISHSALEMASWRNSYY